MKGGKVLGGIIGTAAFQNCGSCNVMESTLSSRRLKHSLDYFLKIHLLSDLHLESANFRSHSLAEADVVVLAGDIHVGAAGVEWAIEMFPEHPVLYVPGNHEFYFCDVDQTLVAMRHAATGSNVQILDRGMAEFDGVRFLAATLWTDFKLYAGNDEVEHAWAKVDARRHVPDYDGRIRYLQAGREQEVTPDITQRWHEASCAWLSRQLCKHSAGPTVVVTHHAPSGRSIAPDYVGNPISAAYASNLDALAQKATVWMHGHTHCNSAYTIGNCRVVCNPRGYGSEVEGFDPGFVIDL